jgi:hypothetical protein
VSFWENPYTIAIGSGLAVLAADRLIRRYRTKRRTPTASVEGNTGGTNIANTAPIGYMHVGDVHKTPPTEAPDTTRIAYGTRRVLTRIHESAVALTSGSFGSEVDPRRLDEVDAAVQDFNALNTDLHLLEPSDLRERVSHFMVTVRRQVGEIRANNERVRAIWEKGHDEHRSGRVPRDVWISTRRNIYSQETSVIHMASHHKIQAWRDDAKAMLDIMPNDD